MPLSSKAKSFMIAATGGHVALVGYLTWTGNETFYRDIVMPLGRTLVPDAEKSHSLMVKACHYGVVPRCHYHSDRLKTSICGLKLDSPLGLAAGFDKNCEALRGIFRMGFSFAEVGALTPYPQEGNPSPRVFRLLEDRAVINRYGFNNVGHVKGLENLCYSSDHATGPVGVNLGANKTSEDVVYDFVEGIRVFTRIADFFVINVSSPNTPGLRLHQQRDKLEFLLRAVMVERDKRKRRVPVFLKIAPDLTQTDRESIAELALKLNVDGLVISNTTVSRPDSLKSKHQTETGGLSGEPLRELALESLRAMYRLTQGRIPIIGVGGISTGADAYERIRNGASVLQIYTAFTLDGPPIVRTINRQLDQLLQRDGFASVQDAVGVDNPIMTAANDLKTTSAINAPIGTLPT